jgi:hypothetical protein
MLRERRQAFASEVPRLEQRLKAVPERIFRARIDQQARSDLELELSELDEALRSLTAPMQEGCDALLLDRNVGVSGRAN